MYYSATRNLRNRIIRKEDVLTIAQTLEKICETYEGTCTFDIFFYDRTFVSNSSSSLFQTSLLQHKDPRSITFIYTSKLSEHKIEIHLWEDYFAQCESTHWKVSSTDENWFNAMQAKIGAILNGLPKHVWLRNMIEFPYVLLTFFFLLAAEMGALTLFFDFKWGYRTEETTIFIPLPLLIIATLILVMFLSFGTFLLCPNVEFIFDTPKFIARKRIRKTLAWIGGTIIIPIILSLIV